MNFSARSHAYGRGYGYGHPYGYPYGGYLPYAAVPAVALTEEQQTAMAEQQKAFAEQQAKTVQQAVEAQRKLAEQFASNPEQFTAPFGPELARPFDVNFDNIEKHHEAIRNMMEERHNSFARIADPFRPDFAGRETLRDDRRAQAESQREEMMKRVEEQRKASQERHATLRQRFEERRVNREI